MTEIKALLWRSWKAHFWTNAATTAVLTMSFGLILATALFISNLSRILTVWGDEIQITVYLKDDITPDELKNVETSLSSVEGVEKVLYIGKAAAKNSFEKSLSSYGPGFLKSLDSETDNPFPASFFVRLNKISKTPDRIEGLSHQFTQLVGVEDVSYGQEWIKNYSILFKVSKAIATICTVVLMIGCLFTVSNAIRASLSSRREEIEILELVGATQGTIRRPFIIEGAFQGLMASLGAITFLALSYRAMYHSLESIVGMSTLISALSFLSAQAIFFSIIVGITVGAMGSYICVARLNTGWSALRERSY